MKAKSRSAKYYNSHPEAKAKKKRYDSAFQKRKEQVKKRVEANRANRKAGTYGNGDGKDYDHAVGKMVDQSVNRGRKGEGGRKKKVTYKMGGRLKYFTGGNVDTKPPKKNTVKYGTKEYREAYQEGRLSDYTQTLAPVYATVDKETGKNILEEYPYYNKLSEEQKKFFRDKSVIGKQVRAIARDGKGVDAKSTKDFAMAFLRDIPRGSLQAPQSAIVEGIEALRGNEFDFSRAIDPNHQRLPSETIGFDTKGKSWYNPKSVSNFLLDVSLDPTNIVGAGIVKKPLEKALIQTGKEITTKTPLKNAYKLNPRALKENPDVLMYRTQKPNQTQELIELRKLQQKRDVEGFSNLSTQEKLKLSKLESRPNFGQGFDVDVSKIGYYGNPNIRKTRGYKESPEILRVKVPREKALKYNVSNFPKYKKISASPRTEHLLPDELIQSAEKFSFDDYKRLIKEDEKFNSAHWWRGYNKQIKKNEKMNTKKKTYNVGGKLAKAAKKAKEKAKTKKAFKGGGKVKYSYGGKKKAK